MIMNFDLFFLKVKIIQSDQHNQHMSKIHLVHFVHFLQFSNPQQNDPNNLNSENRCIINNHMIKNRLNFEILNSTREKVEHRNKNFLKKWVHF